MSTYSYLQAHERNFWYWAEGGEVLEIPNGGTIAYWQQVKEAIEFLSTEGLPPFGSLLLAFIATNNNYNESIISVGHILNSFKEQDAFTFLKLLSDVPEKYKKGKLRLLLFQAIFAHCHNKISVLKAKNIVAEIKHQNIATLIKNDSFHYEYISRSLKTLELLGRRFRSVEDILGQIAEMPEDVIDVPELELEQIIDTDKIDFTEELIANPKTFHLGCLIKPLWAGFKIPINTTTPSQQQFGGISDLTNKGDFDKLLVSEFANDDMMFLSRLANNEALYLHREIPPAVNSFERIILIDISLTSWGTPKILSLASAIAISRHPKSKSESQTYAVGRYYDKLDLENIEGIIEAAVITDTCLHPAVGIEQFLNVNDQLKHPEIFLITTVEALKQQAMQRVLAENNKLFKYLVLVSKTGNIDFYKYQFGNKKLIQSVALNLEKLWQKKQIKIKKVEPIEEINDESPDLDGYNYPILFPTPAKVKKTFEIDDKTYTVANGVLMQSDIIGKQHLKGQSVIYTGISMSGSFYMAKNEAGQVLFLYYNPLTKCVTLLNVTTRQLYTVNFPRWKNTCSFYNNKFHVLSNMLYCFNIVDGELLVEECFGGPEEKWMHGNKTREITTFESSPLYITYSTLKKVNFVYINMEGKLCFNKHMLSARKFDIRFEISTAPKSIYAYNDDSKQIFKFLEGSTVTINSLGVAILKSSNPNIATIYIPLVLDFYIGIATSFAFAGNKYFHKNEYTTNSHEEFEVYLNEVGNSALNVVRVIKDLTGLSLNECNSLVMKKQKTLIFKTTDSLKANHFIQQLKQIDGAKGEILKTGFKSNKQDVSIVDITGFYDTYVKAFIKHIQNYATSNKTE